MKLIKNYPDLVRINNNRKSGFVEIRLRDSNKTNANQNSNHVKTMKNRKLNPKKSCKRNH